jgi:hypothetical protein
MKKPPSVLSGFDLVLRWGGGSGLSRSLLGLL